MQDFRGRRVILAFYPADSPVGFALDVRRAALVVTDPQVDFLSPVGIAWSVAGTSVEQNGTVENIERLLKTVRDADMPIAISPHDFYPTDRGWRVGSPLETLVQRIGMSRRRPHALGGAEGSGAELMLVERGFEVALAFRLRNAARLLERLQR